MMAEKVEMKRTLLQHDLCRIQVFHIHASRQLPPGLGRAEKRDTVARSFVTTLLTYSPAYTITEADWYYPPGLPLLHSATREINELNFRLKFATFSACNRDILQEYSEISMNVLNL